MRILIVALLMLGSVYGAKDLDFLLSRSLSNKELLVRLRGAISLRKTDDLNYFSAYGGSFKTKKLRRISCYIVKKKLIWVKMELVRAESNKEFFMEKFGENTDFTQQNRIFQDGVKVRGYRWDYMKKRSLTLVEHEYIYRKEKIFNHGLEINLYSTVNSQRGRAKKTESRVVLQVPLTPYVRQYALARAASYTTQQACYYASYNHFKTENFDMWPQQKRSLKSKMIKSHWKSVKNYYYVNIKKLEAPMEPFTKTAHYREFKRFLWSRLISHKPVIIGLSVIIEKLNLKKRENGSSYSTPIEFTKEMISYKIPNGKKLEEVMVKSYKVLLVGLDRQQDKAIFSIENGESFELDLLEVYSRASEVLHF